MTKPVYAFTGPESAGREIIIPLEKRLARLPEPVEVVTGAALGVDTLAFEVTAALWPEAKQTIIVPNFRHNSDLVRRATGLDPEIVKIILMPASTGPLDRNTAMVYRCTALIALPASARQYRSGTWNTIRTARRMAKRVYLWPLPALLA